MNDQHQRRICRFDWGRLGAQRAAARGDVLVIVDVLSFSTAITAAVDHGGIIFPSADLESARALASSVGAEVAQSRAEARRGGGYSLSPLTYENLPVGTRLVLPSRNGATCTLAGHGAVHILFGCITNCEAVGETAQLLSEQSDCDVSVVACGELEDAPVGSEELRFAVEDYLGAGSILSSFTGPFTAEAELCRSTFRHHAIDLERLLLNCESGRYLVERDFTDDVLVAAQSNQNRTVPILTSHGIRSCPTGTQ